MFCPFIAVQEMASKAKKTKKTNGYKMPAPIPSGFIVKNNQKKSWKVGISIGKGGFGEIYCCCKYILQISACVNSLAFICDWLNYYCSFNMACIYNQVSILSVSVRNE